VTDNRWVFGADEPADPTKGTGFVIKSYWADGNPAVVQLVITKDNHSTPENESNVGIGTTNPTRKLQVETASGAAVYGKDANNNYGYLGEGSYGVYGQHSSGNFGLLGDSVYGAMGNSATGTGVYGTSSGGNGAVGTSSTGTGVYGVNTTTGNYGYLGDAVGHGVYGKYGETGPYGYLGGSSYGVYGQTNSDTDDGVRGVNTGSGIGTGVYGQSGSASGSGVAGQNNNGTSGYGVYGVTSGTSVDGNSAGVYGTQSPNGNHGWLGNYDYGAYGKYGLEGGSGNSGALGTINYGVQGSGIGGHTGVYGSSTSGAGVSGISTSGDGVFGSSSGGHAGHFDGNLWVEGKAGIGAMTPNSKLQVAGSFATAYTTIGADWTANATNSIIAVDASTSNVTITLPAASGCEGRVYTIKRIDDTSGGHSASVARTGSDHIDAATSYGLDSQWKYVTVVSDGVDKWLVVANGP
jgi:hypothetical protein